MQASPSTIVQAYDRLAAEEVIAPRQGSGFYVTGRALPPLSLAHAITPAARAIDPFWVSRQSLDSYPTVLKLGSGWLTTDWMPDETLRKAIRVVARGKNTILSDCGSTKGPLRLRRLLTSQFSEEGLVICPDQILLTGSDTQTVDLICRLLVRPDALHRDRPGYQGFRADGPQEKSHPLHHQLRSP